MTARELLHLLTDKWIDLGKPISIVFGGDLYEVTGVTATSRGDTVLDIEYELEAEHTS